MHLEVGGAGGELLRVVVADITDSHIVLDANPPLAGKDLIFQIELVECLAK
jgi:peptidylprolyl isomerase